LLECEACYEELYSFAPLREIIKNNIKEFQKAARPRKSFAGALINSIITALKNIADIFNNLPQTAKVAIPGMAVVIMVITVYFFSLRPQFDDFNLIVQKDSEDLILHPPDHIASKAYGDSATASGYNNLDEEGKMSELFRKNMYIEKNFERRALVFRWPRVSDIDHYRYYLSLIKNQKMISPVTTLQDTLFMYPIESIPKKQKMIWNLSVCLKDGKTYTFTKQFIINY
ncbi:MAG: hypothetical protein P8078_11285, partial [bacterium]